MTVRLGPVHSTPRVLITYRSVHTATPTRKDEHDSGNNPGIANRREGESILIEISDLDRRCNVNKMEIKRSMVQYQTLDGLMARHLRLD